MGGHLKSNISTAVPFSIKYFFFQINMRSGIYRHRAQATPQVPEFYLHAEISTRSSSLSPSLPSSPSPNPEWNVATRKELQQTMLYSSLQPVCHQEFCTLIFSLRRFHSQFWMRGLAKPEGRVPRPYTETWRWRYLS